MGEVQRYGALSSSLQKASVSSSTYAGMGDLRAAERRSAVKSGEMSASKTYVGMGDLRVAERSPAVKTSGASRAKSYVGMGDVQRYDSDSFVQSRNGR